MSSKDVPMCVDHSIRMHLGSGSLFLLIITFRYLGYHLDLIVYGIMSMNFPKCNPRNHCGSFFLGREYPYMLSIKAERRGAFGRGECKYMLRMAKALEDSGSEMCWLQVGLTGEWGLG